MSTSRLGQISELKAITRLAQEGYTISIPYGNAAPYDILVDDGTSILRVQVKTGRIRNGALVFGAEYGHRSKIGTRLYTDLIDLFLVYCADNDTLYRFTAQDIGTLTKPSFRIDAARNGQLKDIRWAKDFEF